MKEFTERMDQLLNGLATDVTENMQWIEYPKHQFADELAKHFQEVNTFIISQVIDILLISETHFTNNLATFVFQSTYHTIHSYNILLW